MDFNFKDNAFINLIRSKKNQILKKTSSAVQESEGFKVIFTGLKNMIKNNAFNGAKLIVISESDIIKIKLDKIDDFNKLYCSNDFSYNQKVTINDHLEVIAKERIRLTEDSNEARKEYLELSKGGEVIFLLIKDKINYFIDGDDSSESTFFSIDDLNTYNKKKEISEINEVFGAYQESLKDRKNYCKFFIGVSHLKSLHVDLKSSDDIKKFIKDNSFILKNKPEDTFRDDLRHYLQVNLKVSQVKEFILENMKRLDIYLYDEYGEIYLIEVKWVGQSVHQEGKKLGHEFKGKDINPAAVHQALEYLDQLHKKGQNIIRGFLVVFDARKEELEDTVGFFDESLLNETEMVHYKKFEKIKDLRVKNLHPS